MARKQCKEVAIPAASVSCSPLKGPGPTWPFYTSAELMLLFVLSSKCHSKSGLQGHELNELEC